MPNEINLDTISSYHIDVLQELGNIGAGNAATALAKMLDKKIDMSVPRSRIMKFSEVGDFLGGAETEVVGILLGIQGDITGHILFVLNMRSAQILVNILMGLDIDEPLVFNEITSSALKEIGNILTGSYLGALSSLTNLKIISDIPGLAVDMAGAIVSVPAIEFSKSSETVLYIENKFTYGSDSIIGDFFLVPNEVSYGRLLNALGVV